MERNKFSDEQLADLVMQLNCGADMGGKEE